MFSSNTLSKLGLVTLLLSMLGCSSISDMKQDIQERMFGKELSDPPTELKEFKASVEPKVMWHASVGKAGDNVFTPVATQEAVYAASAEGDVYKLDKLSGKLIWRTSAGEKLSGGVGLGDNLVLVGSPKGYVIAFDQSGNLLWKSKVSSEILSAPKYDYGVVVVRAGDSRIFGLNAVDGSRKWVYERATPTLALRSNAGVVLDGGAAYAGFAGGKLVAIRVEDGKTIWETSVAQPKGTTEIERIADITSVPVVDGPVVYAVAYQGKVAAVDRREGSVIWSRDISSYTGLNVADSRLYVTHTGGAIYSLDYSAGKTFWRQADLKNRQLTQPLPMGNVVAFGDVEGYVHLLSREDGAFEGRIKTGGNAIMAQMTELGTNGLLAQTVAGDLYAIALK